MSEKSNSLLQTVASSNYQMIVIPLQNVQILVEQYSNGLDPLKCSRNRIHLRHPLFCSTISTEYLISTKIINFNLFMEVYLKKKTKCSNCLLARILIIKSIEFHFPNR